MPKYEAQDRYFKKAKEEGYRARSAFKLQAIDDKFHLLKSGMRVLDLGAAPGSFLQYISGKVGEKGLAIGIDLQKIENLGLQNVATYQGDIFDNDLYKKVVQENGLDKFDLITSDLAPKTTGISFVDGGASLDLNLQVLEVAREWLKKKGSAVIKILPGFDEGKLLGPLRKIFVQVKKYRPEAIRKSSGESYIICINKR